MACCPKRTVSVRQSAQVVRAEDRVTDTEADNGRMADAPMDGVRRASDAAADGVHRMPDTAPDSVQRRADAMLDSARWMTFAELAAARGISQASASRLVRRRRWRRQIDNQGRVRVLVPSEDNERPDTPMDIVRELVRGLEVTFKEQIEIERVRANREQQRADSAEARAERAEQRAERAEGDAEALRQAEADRQGRGRWARIKAAWRGG
jgi:hypothetical protein